MFASDPKEGAVQGLFAYARSARQSGRTTRMIETLGATDVVVVLTERDAQTMRRMIRAAGKSNRVIACPPNPIALAEKRNGSEARHVPDHIWVEDYYAASLDRASADLNGLIEGRTRAAIGDLFDEPAAPTRSDAAQTVLDAAIIAAGVA